MGWSTSRASLIEPSATSLPRSCQKQKEGLWTDGSLMLGPRSSSGAPNTAGQLQGKERYHLNSSRDTAATSRCVYCVCLQSRQSLPSGAALASDCLEPCRLSL